LVGTRYLADPTLRRSYAEEIAPRTEGALQCILRRVDLPAPRRLLDLGAGTGVAGQTIKAIYPEVVLTSVDYVPGPGVISADLSRPVRPHGVEGQFDWLLAAHLLNELARTLSSQSLANLVQFWCTEFLAPEGVLILVEPALRQTSRGLLQVRDRLIERGLVVIAPCMLQGPCPALNRERDFCHDSAPAIVSKRSRVDFSYVVLRRQNAVLANPLHYRVVSDPMKDKGRLRLFVCGNAGRYMVTRLDRHRTKENQGFDELTRGELTKIENGVAHTEGIHLSRESAVSRIR
jgi:ribosomal protein RSM22 (predicted rRNA methylase)